MIIREATVADIEQLMIVRFAVKENVLTNRYLNPHSKFKIRK